MPLVAAVSAVIPFQFICSSVFDTPCCKWQIVRRHVDTPTVYKMKATQTSEKSILAGNGLSDTR
jgi:hypothetical protein